MLVAAQKLCDRAATEGRSQVVAFCRFTLLAGPTAGVRLCNLSELSPLADLDLIAKNAASEVQG